MPKIIISTVGTSLITKQINWGDLSEKNLSGQLTDHANDRRDQLSQEPELLAFVDSLAQRAKKKLAASDVTKIRWLSAELNGIYGIYEEDLSSGRSDIHYLVATDTLQGQTTAEIVREFLVSHGVVNTNILTPAGLSTANTRSFAEGVDTLIEWLTKEVDPLRDRYQVYFNLVGGFKSLQGYMNTLGMFYADRIVYIFEGDGAELITIPRLPIAIDRTQLVPHAAKLALLAEGDGLAEAAGVPEGLVAEVDGRYILSNWGSLIWTREKTGLLGEKLLEFPGLVYRDRFRADFNRDESRRNRVLLQERLARASYLFTSSGNSTQPLVNSGLRYSPLTSKNIDHFRVDLGLRVTCRVEGRMLVMYRYGEHEIEENPE